MSVLCCGTMMSAPEPPMMTSTPEVAFIVVEVWMVQPSEAAAPVLPAASIARTWKVLVPAVRPVRVTDVSVVEVQVVPPSVEYW